tara:strand:- start:329 stop:451 length:123 start_codon:yes stop_codon:yes gene_type:complete
VQKRLDYEMGLRTNIPEGWGWGDDTHALLSAAGISTTNRF